MSAGDFNQAEQKWREEIWPRGEALGTRAIYTLAHRSSSPSPPALLRVQVPLGLSLAQAAVRRIPLYHYSPNSVNALRM
jgi:hypothetical protein